MEERQNNKSQCKMIVECFIEKQALEPSRAICIDEVNVNLNQGQIRYLINDLMKDEFIKATCEEKLWFDKTKWDSTIKSISRTYLAILCMPILLTVIIGLVLKQL